MHRDVALPTTRPFTAFVPKIIKYYLNEDAVLPNVPTFICSDPQELNHVLDNIQQMVVKPTNESGGYGLLIGPQSSQEQCNAYKDKIRANPRNFVAQPMLVLSTVPTLVENGVEGRHVDLRPFILSGPTIEETYVVPGGLTRVALRKGSIVVNSSQGGGSKDTWVLSAGREAELAPLSQDAVLSESMHHQTQTRSEGTPSQTLGNMTQSQTN